MYLTSLTIGFLPQYVLDLNRHLKTKDLDYLCISDECASTLITGQHCQSTGLTLAIYRYNQILPTRTMCFFESNIDDFISIYHEAETQCAIIRECLSHGMSQRNVSDIFGIPPKTLRVLFPNMTIDKTCNRTQLSISALLLIDNEVQSAEENNKLIFSTVDFARLMLRISNILIVNGLEQESNIAPIIRYIFNEEYRVKVYQESTVWNNQNGEIIEIEIK